MWVWSLGWEHPLEEAMATHSSILAWKIPWTEESGGLQSMGLQRVGHDWATEHTHTQLLDRIQQWRLQLLDFCLGGGYFFIFGCAGFLLLRGLFPGCVRRAQATLWWWCMAFSLQWLLLWRGTGSRASRHQELRLLGSACRLNSCGVSA